MDLNKFQKEVKELNFLGNGSFGVVFEAEYAGKRFAIKKIPKSKIDEDEYFKEALDKEINFLKIMSRFENSVKFYLNYEEDKFYVLVLELCEDNLNDLLKKKNHLSSHEILYIMEGLNKVFKYMFNNGIIHRDLKPDNILIKYDNSRKGKYKYIPKITDYGFSKYLENGIATTFGGTPGYRAPEIKYEEDNKYNNKADLFSIGVIMYVLYFNEFPFKFSEINGKIQYRNKKLKDCEDKILDDLINKLLIIDPEKRISWEEYFNHLFFKGNQENEVEGLNNQLNKLELDENNEHKIIKFYDYHIENILYQNEIEIRTLENNPKIRTIDECLSINDTKLKDSFFILAILGKYLEKIGIKVQIEENSLSRNYESKEYHKNLIQSICNNYILKDKYLLDFDLDNNRINELFSDDTKRCDFNEKIKKLIMKAYHLELLIINQKRENSKFTVVMVIKSNFNKKISKEELIKCFEGDEDLKTLSKIYIEKMTSIITLSTSMLSPKNNNKNNKWSNDKTKGGEEYHPPYGWINYGINIRHNFNDSNRAWISRFHKTGEWCVGYCGLKTKSIEQIYENDDDIRHPGKKVGIGVYCTSLPSLLEQDAETIELNGENYKVGFMLRIKPEKIRASSKNKNIFVVNGNDDEFRPYGILIKKL